MTVSASRFRLHDAAALQPVLDRMARQAASVLDQRPVTLVGVLRRGAPLADMLAERLARIAPRLEVARTDLLVKRYGDDLTLLHPDTSLTPTPEQAQADLAGRQLVVVDDVLYQGHSAFRVLEFLHRQRAASMHVAVLVDRCALKVPVRADIAGLTLQIADEDVIECSVPPFEPEFAVDVWRPAAERVPA
jgi:pyrimidine operon attenuation protein/uracil phosphoribosyltransferase